MKQRYQMLLSSPLWIPIVGVTLILVFLFVNKTFKSSCKELVEIIKFAWDH